jgi:hypothetical protein
VVHTPSHRPFHVAVVRVEGRDADQKHSSPPTRCLR